MQDAGLELPVTLEAIDFTDEEGTLIGTLGSLALAGQLTRAGPAAPRGGRELLVAELARMGLTEDGILAARRDPASLAGYLELHIEQGPVLERAGIDIGIVTGIIGAASFDGRVRGRGAPRRDDADGRPARCGCRRGGLRARRPGDWSSATSPGCVATVGDIRVEPGSFNVVPGRATASAGVPLAGSATSSTRSSGRSRTARTPRRSASASTSRSSRSGAGEPAPTDERIRAALDTTPPPTLGLTTMELPSGAGHDAQALAAITPSGMVFVPSVGGISHDPAEHTAGRTASTAPTCCSTRPSRSPSAAGRAGPR